MNVTQSNPLTALLTRPRPKTCAELRSLIGQPYAVCLICGSPLWSITNAGEAICWGCDWDRATASRGIALRIMVLAVGGGLSRAAAGNSPGGAGEAGLPAAPGVGVAADYDQILADRERAAAIDAGAYHLDRPGAPPGRPRRWRIIPIDNNHFPRPPRDQLAEEWFEGLPTV